MKILIVYGTKTGTTKECAEIINKKFNDSTLIDISKNSNIDLSLYDLIIIGTSIRIGMFHKDIKRFIKNNIEILKKKKMAYFVCCAFSENYKTYFESELPKELIEKAITLETFGGKLDIEKQKGLDKFIVKMINKSGEKKEAKIVNKNIEEFIKKVNKEIT